MTDQLNWHNKLYFGDNLEIMRNHLSDESIDLVYLDPPFNSKASYNVLFHEKDGKDSPAQITAFEDTWHWDEMAESTYWDVVKNGPADLSELMQALRQFLGSNDVLAYLTMISIRLVEMRRVLKETGTIYLHCDPTASHYLKIVLDSIFGVRYFLNEVVWKRTSAHSDVVQGALHMGRIHDVVFRYSKGSSPTRNPIYVPYTEDYIESVYRYVEEDGRRYQTQPLHAKQPGGDTLYEWKGQYPPPGRYWAFSRENMEKLDKEERIYYSKTGVPRYKIYLEESKGKPLQDIWDDIPPVHTRPSERLGYPTQKPEGLLERIIAYSSNEGDVVLDPFCGCGTTVAVAERLHRRWIGIDVTHLAITLMKKRLEDTFGSELSPFEIIGDPKDVGSAEALAQQNRHQFEWWALSLVDARPAQDKKKGADKGVDGYLNFFDDESGKAKKIVVQVKSGHVGASIIRDLKGTVEREKAVIGALITLQPPTGPMRKEAVSAGYYEPEHFPGKKYPKVQILTIEELLNGKELQYPRLAPESTFKKAKRKKKAGEDEQGSLLDAD